MLESAEEADLRRYAADKVQRALDDVLQLVDGMEQKMRIALFASSVCIGAAGAYLAADSIQRGEHVSEDEATIAILNRLLKRRGQ